ncbi:MAG: C4-dicarboxylate ABC transporter substrate-binding protein [Rhizobiales bacterium 24-66-13]|jgi:TRAP-type C4-dicarboxylate transport system substrate-binding protein|nr:MAG: C4-dicarboxylate ABC transporter substrate-binding protein [Rhizobiales bacterium 35-66-30]OYZ82899.1 MAG: C4-dicarboxylate ABC transporter substrate-binding protein [Rhizobiales bacterium 24-66-13]OZB11885.1 MAG: C4-dicarboxylate ABC transporter substrate-binding protein [Rhizobiales bacterium 39-66-18]HQS45443.1 TRAP transporter substrate-binding protein DctP [Xanthobacteraceae bacterium]
MSKTLLASAVVTALIMAVPVAVPIPAQAEPITLKFAHQWPQDEKDYVVAAAIKFAREVEARSKGEIKITSYPAQSLAKASNTHIALKTGTVDLSVYPYIYAAGAIPEMNLILMPGIWKTHDEVFAFRKSPAWQHIEAKAQAYGFKTLSWIQISGGVASSGAPVHGPKDVNGKKVRAAGKYMEAALHDAGATPVSMPSSDNYNAMQLGLLDAMWTSSSSFGAFRLYEVSKAYTSPEDYSVYFTIEPIAISMKTWEKLTPEQQKILSEVGASLEMESLAGAKAEDARIAREFAEHGVKVTKMTLDEWNSWQPLFRRSHEQFKVDVPQAASILSQMLAKNP